MRTWRKGLGDTNVQAIAQAMLGGQLSNLNFSTEYFQPAYMPVGQMSALPQSDYISDSGAALIAGLLNGSVFQADPPGNPQVAPGYTLPPANWIRLADGNTVLPGNLIQPGTVLSFQSVCDAETYFANAIPGGELSSDCAGTSDPIITQSGGTVTLPVAAAPAPSTNYTTPIAVTPLPVSAPVQSSGSSAILANPTPAPGAAPNTTPPNSSNTSVSTTTSDWTSIFTETSIGGVPNWVWMAGVGVALFAFAGGKH